MTGTLLNATLDIGLNEATAHKGVYLWTACTGVNVDFKLSRPSLSLPDNVLRF